MINTANIDWEDIGDIKHRIRHSLTKAVKIEIMAKEAGKVVAMAQELREEIQGEIDKLDEIINKQNGGENEEINNRIVHTVV